MPIHHSNQAQLQMIDHDDGFFFSGEGVQTVWGTKLSHHCIPMVETVEAGVGAGGGGGTTRSAELQGHDL